MDKNITNKNSGIKKIKEISFIKKCIILANIFKSGKKFVVNSFNNIPYVKLFAANINDRKYTYTKIKGALLLIYEEDGENKNYFFQIYDIDDYSMVFNIPLNQKILEEISLEEGFICIPTKYYYIGFKFSSMEVMRPFFMLLKCGQLTSDINIKAKVFNCQNTEIIKVIKKVKENLDEKLKKIDKEINIINKQKNSFQKLDDLYCLINCIEYSEVNNKINIFIDKTFNPFIIKSYIDTYRNTENKSALPYKIVFNDYSQIKNKKAYVDILVRNLINNFEEEKRLIIFKREHKKRHEKEQYKKNNNIDIRGSAMITRPKYNLDDKPKYKNQFQSNMNTIKEED
jgi:hypothetical protein